MNYPGSWSLSGTLVPAADGSVPSAAAARLRQARACLRDGRPVQAIEHFQAVLRVAPRHPAALNGLGLALCLAGRVREALPCFQQAVSAGPNDAEARYNLAKALEDLGHPEAAAAEYQRALALRPDFPAALNNLGNVHMAQGRSEAAAASYRRSLQLQPDNAAAHYNLGIALDRLGESQAAAASYRQALDLLPAFPEAWNNLGSVLTDLGQARQAVASLRRALELRPDFPEACYNLGNALHAQSQFGAALASYRLALKLKPDYAEAHYNLGNTLKDLGQHRPALASYRQALALRPDYDQAQGSLLFTHNFLADLPAEDMLREARRYGEMVLARARPFQAWHGDADAERRLRVGLVSGDLREHPVGYFLEGMVGALDDDRIELYAYANQPLEDSLSARLKPHFSVWRQVHRLDDAALARQIHEDGIDLLVDLSGHTAHNRLPVFAWRPAPVQLTWLGYFATTGVPGMDYILGDPQVIAAGEAGQFTERVWRLPECYYCFTPPATAPEVAPLPALHTGHVTFGCFNRLAKMHDGVVELWARVLQAVPASRLYLKARELTAPHVLDGVRQRFADHGIAAARLRLEGLSPRDEYLTAYGQVDVALDPFPYPGGTTTLEALWMGVPVLSLKGGRFISHQGETILHNAGLAEWLAEDAADYVAKARACSQDLAALADVRRRLRQQLAGSPLLDAPRFARHWEAALRGMWRAWCAVARQGGGSAAGEQGLALCRAGRFAAALPHLRQAVGDTPADPRAQALLGLALHRLGEAEAALDSLRAAVALAGDDPAAHNSLGNVLKDLGRLAEAAACYRQALRLQPAFFEARNNLGVVQQSLGEAGAAIASYRDALELRPDVAAVHSNLGIALKDTGRFRAAIAAYRRALELQGDFPPALLNLGNALLAVGETRPALDAYRRAVALRPDDPEARSRLLFALNYLPGLPVTDMLAEAGEYGRCVLARAQPLRNWLCRPEPGRLLRVGLVSGDLREHPVGYFLEAVLAHLDATRVEIHAYVTHPLRDPLSERIAGHCSVWVEAMGMSDAALAARIHEDAIDILVDLAGHTAHNRLPLFAWRPAPVQLTWLGYAATTGVPGMDYILGDPWCTPAGEAAQFTEILWRLPDSRLCFTAPADAPPPGPLPALENGYVTFACCNTLAKLNDAVLALWARILLALPGARLLLKARELSDADVRAALEARFAALGVAPARLMLEGHSPREAYLADYRRADLALDPFPYPGGTTTLEALWMGVPVLAMAGDRCLGHQGEAILANAGLVEWIARGGEDYVAKAVARAGELAALAELRGRLRAQVQASPLCDAAGFARHLQAAWRQMWRRWCAAQQSIAGPSQD